MRWISTLHLNDGNLPVEIYDNKMRWMFSTIAVSDNGIYLIGPGVAIGDICLVRIPPVNSGGYADKKAKHGKHPDAINKRPMNSWLRRRFFVKNHALISLLNDIVLPLLIPPDAIWKIYSSIIIVIAIAVVRCGIRNICRMK